MGLFEDLIGFEMPAYSRIGQTRHWAPSLEQLLLVQAAFARQNWALLSHLNFCNSLRKISRIFATHPPPFWSCFPFWIVSIPHSFYQSASCQMAYLRLEITHHWSLWCHPTEWSSDLSNGYHISSKNHESTVLKSSCGTGSSFGLRRHPECRLCRFHSLAWSVFERGRSCCILECIGRK